MREASRGGEWGVGIVLPSRLKGLGGRHELPQRGLGQKTNFTHTSAIRKTFQAVTIKCGNFLPKAEGLAAMHLHRT